MNKPIILSAEEFSEERLQRLRGKKTKESDFYEKQLHELFEVTHPDRANDEVARRQFLEDKGTGDNKGSWVYFPWLNTLVHIVNEEDYYSLRTNRNKLLLTAKEQEKLNNAVVGVAGMSVGAGIAIGCVYSGISNTIKIADADIVDTTNLNRIEVGVQDLYEKKTILAARRIYEANPYAQVLEYDHNLTESNLEEFFSKGAKLDLVVDEIDDFKMKVLLRTKARETKTPLLMMTSIGDNLLVDIERYDTDSSTKPFQGKAEEAVKRISSSTEITREDMIRYSVELVEKKHVPKRALQSLQEIGKTLSGRPQLFSTVSASGGVASMVIRELILGTDSPKSGRYFVDLKQIVS